MRGNRACENTCSIAIAVGRSTSSTSATPRWIDARRASSDAPRPSADATACGTAPSRQEPNFHSLYIDLIDRFGSKALHQLLVRTTHKYVQVLLTSDRIKRDSGERTLLKNLGSWLGSLTIKRNKPVLHKDLDLKACLFQAYEQGKLVAVWRQV